MATNTITERLRKNELHNDKENIDSYSQSVLSLTQFFV